jgi:hypothetical protein
MRHRLRAAVPNDALLPAVLKAVLWYGVGRRGGGQGEEEEEEGGEQ